MMHEHMYICIQVPSSMLIFYSGGTAKSTAMSKIGKVRDDGE